MGVPVATIARRLPSAACRRACVFPATSITLATQYLEDAVIEEDIGQLLVLLARYADMADAVHFAVTEMDRMLMGDRACPHCPRVNQGQPHATPMCTVACLSRHVRVRLPVVTVFAADTLKRFIDDSDLSTFVTIVNANRSRPDTLHHVLSVLHILAGNGAWACAAGTVRVQGLGPGPSR
jgi:hypothetical protein